jgi:uroporphyrinogen-III synthase
MHILITRPEPDASRWQGHFAAMGIATTVDPLLRIEHLPVDGLDLTDAQALVATSRNGLRGLAASPVLRRAIALPIYTVGPGTADYAREIGFTNITVGPSSARELAPVIAALARPNAGRLMHLSGDKIAFDLAAALAPCGLTVERVVVYRSQPADSFRLETIAALVSGAIDTVMLMSPLSAATFVSLLSHSDLYKHYQRLVYVCLSHNVAELVQSLNPVAVHVAAEPSSDSMLTLLERLALAGSGR